MLNSKLLSAMGGANNYIEEVFSTWLYSGNGGTQTITNGINLGGRGGLVWIKNRNSGNAHGLWDTVRGAGTGGATASNRALSSNLTDAQGLAGLSANTDYLSAFTSSGFTVVDPGIAAEIANATGQNYVSWSFRDQPKFFDVVTYTGTGANRTIAHNLQSVPGCIMVKRTDNTGDWQVYHRSLANTQYMTLNSDLPTSTGATRWNSTTPTNTVFSLGTDATVNASGGTYVAYIFAHDAGGFGLTGADNVITCGSFTTDGSGNATVNLGYEPQWVIIKSSNLTAPWWMLDTMRGWNQTTDDKFVRANQVNAESGAQFGTPTETGFTATTQFGAANTFIYIAIRRGPMKVPTTGTTVYNGIARSGTGLTDTVTGVGFAPDLAFASLRASFGAESGKFDKLRGVSRYLVTNSSVAEASDAGTSLISFDMDGITLGATSTSYINGGGGYTYINHLFKRAPGFLDQVCYTGTGNIRTVAHNLAAVPELMIMKLLSAAGFNWAVYAAPQGATQSMFLNTTAASVTNTSYLNSTTPTSSVFTLGVNSDVNGGTGTYVAYLFASCPAVSKVFSYTGNGSSQTINCGFTGGARFVLIKRTDSTGDWYVWDSARGIVAGNDPRLSLNTTAAEVTTDDSVDTNSTGFVVNQVAATNVNVNAATYIGLAIA